MFLKHKQKTQKEKHQLPLCEAGNVKSQRISKTALLLRALRMMYVDPLINAM